MKRNILVVLLTASTILSLKPGPSLAVQLTIGGKKTAEGMEIYPINFNNGLPKDLAVKKATDGNGGTILTVSLTLDALNEGASPQGEAVFIPEEEPLAVEGDIEVRGNDVTIELPFEGENNDFALGVNDGEVLVMRHPEIKKEYLGYSNNPVLNLIWMRIMDNWIIPIVKSSATMAYGFVQEMGRYREEHPFEAAINPYFMATELTERTICGIPGFFRANRQMVENAKVCIESGMSEWEAGNMVESLFAYTDAGMNITIVGLNVVPTVGVMKGLALAGTDLGAAAINAARSSIGDIFPPTGLAPVTVQGPRIIPVVIDNEIPVIGLSRTQYLPGSGKTLVYNSASTAKGGNRSKDAGKGDYVAEEERRARAERKAEEEELAKDRALELQTIQRQNRPPKDLTDDALKETGPDETPVVDLDEFHDPARLTKEERIMERRLLAAERNHERHLATSQNTTEAAKHWLKEEGWISNIDFPPSLKPELADFNALVTAYNMSAEDFATFILSLERKGPVQKLFAGIRTQSGEVFVLDGTNVMEFGNFMKKYKIGKKIPYRDFNLKGGIKGPAQSAGLLDKQKLLEGITERSFRIRIVYWLKKLKDYASIG